MLDQCSARSPRSVLEMVGASSRRTPRLPLTKGTRDRNAVEKRWWPTRRIFPIFGAVLSLARGASRQSASVTLFPHRPRRTKLLVGAIEPPQNGAQTRPSSVFERRRQVGGPAPRALPSPGAACAGGAPNRPRPRARAVRPARGNPWGRSGRLHAPEAARTGPVNALRRCSSWSPPGRWLNGHNGHFSCQPGRDHVCQLPGPYGSGFNGPRAVLNFVPSYKSQSRAHLPQGLKRGGGSRQNGLERRV